MKQVKSPFTHEQLLRVLTYDPVTGFFHWREHRGPRTVKGKKAGTLGTRGYVQMWLYGGQYTAHRLAWFYVNGAWPTKDIDHIDRNRSNNAIANLREATKSENARNRAISGAAKSNRKRIPQFALYHF